MIKTNLLREFARDIIALGSPIFFLLVLIRISMIPKYDYLSQFLIAGVLFLILMFLFKANLYSGLGIIVLIFTSLYYDYNLFTIFGVLVYSLLFFSLIYLKNEKSKVFRGFLFGLISSGVSYYAVKLIFN